MPEPALTAKAVFDRAHEIDSPAERRAYLDAVCADAPALRARVEALLRAYDEAGSFLDTPAGPLPPTGLYQSAGDAPLQTASAAAATAGPAVLSSAVGGAGLGTQIGPYRLVQELGAGGMGAVYLAEQDAPIRRQVALKLIRPGMVTGAVVARFQAERQALTMMDHAGIARVYDAGSTPLGQPFFVMELVHGIPLARFCDEQQLNIRQRLTLFVAICQAVQHAHQKGIIHRDLKPSNVLAAMEDGRPVAKVIDFGLAKATEEPLTDEAQQTQAGVVVGTLQYMSPEQADFGPAGIDTRTDIYALGAILYELLTGTTPLGLGRSRGSNLLDVVRRIKEEEPPAPSVRVGGLAERLPAIAAARRTEPGRLARQLRGELDWIATKALAKDRDRRYETAGDFAKDVERYLADEPVEASPPSWRYRAGKYVRKHRVVLGFLGLALLGVVALSWAYLVATSARTRAESARTRAENAERTTRKALRTSDAIFQVMVRNRTSVSDAEKIALRNLVAAYDEFLAQPAVDEEGRAAAAEAQLTLGNFHALLDQNPEAEGAYAQAIERFRQLAEDFPDVPAYRSDRARGCFNLAILLQRQKRHGEAGAAYQLAIDLHGKLAAEFPADAVYRRDLADDCNNLGAIWRREKQWTKARNAYARAIALLDELTRQSPDDLDVRVSLAAGNHNLGNVVRDEGDARAALASYGRAIELLEPIPQRPADATRYLRNAYWDRAAALGQLHRHKEEVQDWERALALEGQGPDQGALRLFLSAAQIDLQLQTVRNPAPQGLYAAAVLDAQAAAAARQTDELHLQARYADRALALLKQAHAAGWFADTQHIRRLQDDRAFEVLPPDQFKAFIANLHAAKK
jgi:serine/threonine protein kinase/tetratricopeptide (TPR) repeat protein